MFFKYFDYALNVKYVNVLLMFIDADVQLKYKLKMTVIKSCYAS